MLHPTSAARIRFLRCGAGLCYQLCRRHLSHVLQLPGKQHPLNFSQGPKIRMLLRKLACVTMWGADSTSMVRLSSRSTTVHISDAVAMLKEVLYENHWVDVKLIPGALVINIGDALQEHQLEKK